MDKVEQAVSCFREGFNCAQALLVTYASQFGLDHEHALKISGAFGGGIGSMGEVCGAVTGAVMIIGLKYGQTNVSDKRTKKKAYRLVKEFVNELLESGCYEVGIGIECNDGSIISSMNKKVPINKNLESLEILGKSGISFKLFLIEGYPGSNSLTSKKTFELLNLLEKKNYNYFIQPALNRDIIFSFRVKRPDRRILIQIKDEKNKILYKKKRKYVIPSEMIELKLNLSELQIDPNCKNIEIEVIPRPEVLIEKD